MDAVEEVLATTTHTSTLSTLSALIAQAGEVMRERLSPFCSPGASYVATITLEDLK